MKNINLLIFIMLILMVRPIQAQVVFWTENFNNGCSSNCVVSGYSGVNGAWTLANTGSNGSVANEFFVSCAENGEPVGSCGAGCGNDATLHVGNVPCTLCFVCPNGDCGATYNAGPAFGGEDPATDKRAMSPLISTLGKSSITLTFKYIERGQGTTDDATVEYSINGGTTWNLLSNPGKTPTSCVGGQGLWTSYSVLLPSSCDNISNLKIGFHWVNNSNSGNDPSFAVDQLELSSAASVPPVADFSTASSTFCDSTCISFSDLSVNGPNSWNWLFPGATPATFSGQSPSNICYNVPGTYDVTLIVSNAAGIDTTVKTGFITVNSCYLPAVSFVATDTFFCEKGCIDFTDLSTNNPTSWQWTFNGASPGTSALQNPTNICYNSYGTYSVNLVATNIIGSDSAVYTGYITVNQTPAAPVANVSGGNILTSSPSGNYQWYYNSATISGATNQVYIAQASGDYFVVVTDTNGCQAASNIVNVSFQGIASFGYLSNINILPNPVNDAFTLQIHSPITSLVTIEFNDITGREISQEQLLLTPGTSTYQMNISSLAGGMYLLRIGNSEGWFIKKIIKE